MEQFLTQNENKILDAVVSPRTTVWQAARRRCWPHKVWRVAVPVSGTGR